MISFFYKHAGLVSISSDKWNWTFHLFPSREFQSWGKDEGWYDGPINYYGLGPFFLAVWMPLN